MNNQATLEKLTSMPLWGMKNAFHAYLETSAVLTPDELATHLAQSEWSSRQNLYTQRLLNNANFHYAASLAEVDFLSSRGLDKNLALRLAQGQFIQDHENLLITGATGVGKFFLASALVQQACLLG